MKWEILKARFQRWWYLITHLPSGDCAVTTHLHGKVKCIAAGYSVSPGVIKVTKIFYGVWP